jgi:chromosome segregation ATPase
LFLLTRQFANLSCSRDSRQRRKEYTEKLEDDVKKLKKLEDDFKELEDDVKKLHMQLRNLTAEKEELLHQNSQLLEQVETLNSENERMFATEPTSEFNEFSSNIHLNMVQESIDWDAFIGDISDEMLS